MPAKRARTPSTPQTTAQSLGSALKSARDIMRKDKGLNGDLDRLPLLTWVMFLKFLDDLERQREEEAKLAGKRFRPAIEAPYRWRDWAADPKGITGDDLLDFVNAEKRVLPDGTEMKGLFAYLRSLTSADGDDRRAVIATVFRGVDNRMRSGYLLREVINKVDAIHFGSSDELHTLGALYESLLREMRDAAGDSGEFYTPRPVVRLMVKLLDPRLGETVLDPATGTAGFLVEAFAHLAEQVRTVADRRVLQDRSILGCEPKPLPYLLAQMNLLLHGLDRPRIDAGNSLSVKITEIGEKDRVDVILTNPPFGGEEESGIQKNFPEDKQTSETALLFLQLIMRKLRRANTAAGRPARAAVVVPNGTLFGDGVCARIKRELLTEFNLHTIVRLPNGVFAPYTSIPTNVLFFDRSGPTREVWYWEHALPEGRKNYSKTQPLQFEEFAPLAAWWGAREESERAWRVPAEALLAGGCNLDRKNPNAAADLEHQPPEVLVASILEKERRIVELLEEIRPVLASPVNAAAKPTPLRELLTLREPDVAVRPDETYDFAGVYSFGRGVFRTQQRAGSEISYRRLTRLRAHDFVYPKLMAWEGAFGVVPAELAGLVVSTEFPVFEINTDRVLPEILDVYFRQPAVWKAVAGESIGTNVRRRRLHPQQFLSSCVPLPEMPAQGALRMTLGLVRCLEQSIDATVSAAGALRSSIIARALGAL